ncbi:hypothetical protein FB451DRAFT_970423, partial [Mycena latifolia]
ILAFVYMRSSAPTQEDFDRTPMRVRKNKMVDALEWLKLNWRRTKEEITASVPAGTTAVNETLREYGNRTGKCTFAVHGLTGTEQLNRIKSVALRHLTHKGSMLGIGRSEHPVSMYDNVGAYPGMFPWLSPYGKGGIGHPSHANEQGDTTRKKSLLMYHDK